MHSIDLEILRSALGELVLQNLALQSQIKAADKKPEDKPSDNQAAAKTL